jgi:hypothetical protein
VQVALGLSGVIALADDGQLTVLDAHLQLVGRKAGHRQADAQRALAHVLDVVGGIAFGGRLCGPLDQAPGVLEAEQEGAVE